MPPPAKVAYVKGLRAFTLAEVLITLGIIGVVAALTLPSVISEYREKHTVTALKKNYSILNNAIMRAVAENGDIEDWGTASYDYTDENDENKNIETFNIDIITKYLNIIKNCGHEAKGCFPQRYTMLNGQKERDFENLSYYNKFILADGTIIAFQGYSGTDGRKQGEVWIDVNGMKKPNRIGEDTFLFIIEKSRLIPYQFDNIKTGNLLQKAANGYSLAGWVLTFENLDYLHCKDLEWGKKIKCSK